MEVGDWHRNLSLGQYEEVFRDNGVGGAVLPKLTADDLKEMGVAGVGHRRKILAAIEQLNAASAEHSERAKPASTRDAAHVSSSPNLAERRQLTVMFCDLVSSTAISARLDPEDLRDVIGAYHRCATDCIERDGGFVAKYMGDGVLAYFGYPQAREHDAQRAVKAGLAIVEAAPKLITPAGSPLQVRVGIAIGPVIVGAGAAQEQAVVGETPNLAARLQAIAEPDMVVLRSDPLRCLANPADVLFGIERPSPPSEPGRCSNSAQRRSRKPRPERRRPLAQDAKQAAGGSSWLTARPARREPESGPPSASRCW